MVRRVAVVGSGVAGGTAVRVLRDEGFDGELVLIGDEALPPYERPPLSKHVLRGERMVDDCVLHPIEWFVERSVDLRVSSPAAELDPRGEVVLQDGGRVAFDACLLATGARPRRIAVPGAGLNGVMYLRTAEDASALARLLVARPRIVVVGAGFIGLEVAASARSVGCDVTVLEIAPVPLAHVLGTEVGRSVARLHEEHGVRFRFGEGISAVHGAGRAEEAETTAGARLPCDLVVVGVGVAPNDELAARAGLECRDGVVVDGLCRTSAPGVFAAGDVARWPDPLTGELVRVEHHQNAERQGAAAARAMLGGGVPYDEVPWFWSDQYDTNLQLVGRTTDDAVVRGDLDVPRFTVLYLDGERLAGALAFDSTRDVQVCRRLIARRTPVARDTLARPDTNLASLLRPAP